MMRVSFILVLLVLIIGCAGGVLTVTQKSGGTVLPATYEDGIGRMLVTVNMANGEVLKGRLTWTPPGGKVSTTLITVNNTPEMATGKLPGNKGMYIGDLAGNKGTTMKVELLCDPLTGQCVGLGQSNSGEVFDIHR